MIHVSHLRPSLVIRHHQDDVGSGLCLKAVGQWNCQGNGEHRLDPVA